MQSFGLTLPYYLSYFNMAPELPGGINNVTHIPMEYREWEHKNFVDKTYQKYNFDIYIKPNAKVVKISFYGLLDIFS